MLTKSARYYWDAEACQEPIQSDREPSRKAKVTGAGRNGVRAAGPAYDGTGDFRNLRNVWTFATAPYKGAHFATFPPELARRCILAGSRPGDFVMDPFGGSGTVARVALELRRKALSFDLAYHELAKERTATLQPILVEQYA